MDNQRKLQAVATLRAILEGLANASDWEGIDPYMTHLANKVLADDVAPFNWSDESMIELFDDMEEVEA